MMGKLIKQEEITMNIKQFAILVTLVNIVIYALIGWGLIELFLYLQEYGLKSVIDGLWIGKDN